MTQIEHQIQDALGLHARPAGQIMRSTMRFSCAIKVEVHGKTVNAKSIMSMMQLEAKQGDILRFYCDGADETQAVAALEALLTTI